MWSDIQTLLIPFKRSALIGELKLQSCEKENIFYAAHHGTDENLGSGDFSQREGWIATAYTHERKAEEDVVMISGDTSIIQGTFKDRIGELSKVDYEYMVNVYVWIEVEEEMKGDCCK